MKMPWIKVLTFLPIVVFLLSCDVQESPPKALSSFSQIQSNGMVTFKLVSGADNRVISTSLSEATYNVSGNTLNVNAAGGSMTVSIKSMKMLWCNACTVENPEPLTADTLVMFIHGGSATLNDIQINGFLGLSGQNLGTFKFNGFAHFFQVETVNLVVVKAFNLATDSVYVNSSSIVDTEVNASKVVNVFINSSGDVKYRGNPPVVRLTKTGTGRLIPD